MFGRIGFTELLVIFMILLLVVGPTKLPKLAQSMGEAVREFKKGTKNITKELDDITKVEEDA
ncbi:twin-arginine translocase TatA/TatE family subunit [Clostridium saudiense]|nr:twin-arginine translocase TatA/TatE family subunit [Clostridium saudiense]MBM6859654.1 twin-arginine translocase TatA/TatE family subunit [Clostridium saudiense]